MHYLAEITKNVNLTNLLKISDNLTHSSSSRPLPGTCPDLTHALWDVFLPRVSFPPWPGWQYRHDHILAPRQSHVHAYDSCSTNRPVSWSETIFWNVLNVKVFSGAWASIVLLVWTMKTLMMQLITCATLHVPSLVLYALFSVKDRQCE